MMDILGKIIVVLGCILAFVFVIKFLGGDFNKKSLKIGRRVAVIAFNFKKTRDEIKTGKIVAIKTQMLDIEKARPYAVRFDDGKIDLFRAEEIFTKWGEE